ncbi:SHOCT domain-containing protein [Streptomyces sp. NPDC046712]|uniref:SHOCT domain-containing protein n=1 Tax=Streptomyces sp. NPDC046712 TaxID=3154802 RepID=UPI00340FD04E
MTVRPPVRGRTALCAAGDSARPSAEQILGGRLRRGEIDEEEYRRRLTALRRAET